MLVPVVPQPPEPREALPDCGINKIEGAGQTDINSAPRILTSEAEDEVAKPLEHGHASDTESIENASIPSRAEVGTLPDARACTDDVSHRHDIDLNVLARNYVSRMSLRALQPLSSSAASSATADQSGNEMVAYCRDVRALSYCSIRQYDGIFPVLLKMWEMGELGP